MHSRAVPGSIPGRFQLFRTLEIYNSQNLKWKKKTSTAHKETSRKQVGNKVDTRAVFRCAEAKHNIAFEGPSREEVGYKADANDPCENSRRNAICCLPSGSFLKIRSLYKKTGFMQYISMSNRD